MSHTVECHSLVVRWPAATVDVRINTAKRNRQRNLLREVTHQWGSDAPPRGKSDEVTLTYGGCNGNDTVQVKGLIEIGTINEANERPIVHESTVCNKGSYEVHADVEDTRE